MKGKATISFEVELDDITDGPTLAWELSHGYVNALDEYTPSISNVKVVPIPEEGS